MRHLTRAGADFPAILGFSPAGKVEDFFERLLRLLFKTDNTKAQPLSVELSMPGWKAASLLLALDFLRLSDTIRLKGR